MTRGQSVTVRGAEESPGAWSAHGSVVDFAPYSVRIAYREPDGAGRCDWFHATGRRHGDTDPSGPTRFEVPA